MRGRQVSGPVPHATPQEGNLGDPGRRCERLQWESDHRSHCRQTEGPSTHTGSNHQVDPTSGLEVHPVETPIADRLSAPTGRAPKGGPRGRSPITQLTTLSLPGHPSRGSLVVIGIELRGQQTIGPHRKGSGFGIEVRGLCLDQQFGRQRNCFFFHGAPKITNGAAKVHPYERILSRNATTTRLRRRRTGR
jgi:hypothetical protein